MRALLVATVLISAVTDSSRAEDAPSLLTAPFDAEHAKAAQEAWAKSLGKSSSVEKNSIGMDLVLIPPGQFTMGSPPEEKNRTVYENQVEVTLSKVFYLGKLEITQGQWQTVMGTTPWKGENEVRDGDTFPATYVSWIDAKAFCKKLSDKEKAAYRLPTEAEWEFACRAGTTTRFSFGDDDGKLSEYAWWGGKYGDSDSKGELYAHEVGKKKSNPFGLLDMHGNVYEWCEDEFAAKLPGGTDPLVSEGGAIPLRRTRGGCWGSHPMSCRSAARNSYQPTSRYSILSFRIVRSFGPQAAK